MKIVFVAPFGLGKKTTVWARILPLAKVLASDGRAAQSASDAGHNTPTEPWSVQIIIPPWDTPEDAGKRWVDHGVEIVHVRLGGGLPLITLRLLRAVLFANPDVVHIVKPRAYAGIIQWLLWWFSRAMGLLQGVLPKQPKLILDIDDWEQAWNKENQHSALLSRFLTWQEEWGIRHADGITAASRWLENRAAAYTPQTPLLYLPNGVVTPSAEGLEESEPDLRSQARRHQILYLTRYVEVQPEWLAEFWSALAAQTSPQATSKPGDVQATLEGVELIIAGGPLQVGRDAAFRSAFERHLAAQNPLSPPKDPNGLMLEPAVKWLGLVDQTDIQHLYADASCAIFPAEEVPLQQAKCSVRLATTLLTGLPVVASAVGQQGEYGANGAAKLVPPHASPALFAEAVVEVLVQATSRHQVREQALDHMVTNFNWNDLGRSLGEFYQRVLSK